MTEKQKVIKRLAKASSKDVTREVLNSVYVKERYAEATNGRVLVRQHFDRKQKEQAFDNRTFEKIELDNPYPDTDAVFRASHATPTEFKIAFNSTLLLKFFQAYPRKTKLIFHFKGKDKGLYVHSEDKKVEGVILPLELSTKTEFNIIEEVKNV